MITSFSNASSLSAIRTLSNLNDDIAATENRISTTRKINSAKDNGAVWSIAQKMRSSVTALDSVTSSLARGKGIVDMATTATETVSDLLGQMKAIALAATDSGLNNADRTALNDQFTALRDQIGSVVSGATVGGVNMISGAGTSINPLASESGSTVVVAGQSLAYGGANVTIAANASFNNAAQASALVTQLSTSIDNVTLVAAKLGTGSNALDTQMTFVSKLQDTLEVATGRLVDADMGKESAKLAALKTQQELAAQVLSMANARPSLLLQLFKN